MAMKWYTKLEEEKVPYCFLRSFVKFQIHPGPKKFPILTWIERLRTVTPKHSIEQVPFCFARSSIKVEGHTCWKIDDLNPIWVRLLGWSHLSNPSDLPTRWFPYFIGASFKKSTATFKIYISQLQECRFLFSRWSPYLIGTRWKNFSRLDKYRSYKNFDDARCHSNITFPLPQLLSKLSKRSNHSIAYVKKMPW